MSRREYDNAARSLALRLALHYALRWALLLGSCVLLAAGVWVLLMRLQGLSLPPTWVWYLLGVSVVGISVVLGAWQVPSRQRLLVWLDDASGCGGMLAAGLADWGTLPAPCGVRVRISMLRELCLFLVGSLFLAGCFLLPARVAGPGGGSLDIEDEQASLNEQLQFLEQEQLVSPQTVQETRDLMQKIAEENVAADAAETYELLDLAEARLKEAAQKNIATLANRAASMEMLAEALKKLDQMQLDKEVVASELANLMKELLAGDSTLQEQMQKMILQTGAASVGNLSLEQMKELAKLLRDNADLIREKLKQLAQSPQAGQACQNAGQSLVPMTAEDLKAWLESNDPQNIILASGESQGSSTSQQGSGTSQENGEASRGKGEASRGGGSAPLSFTHKTTEGTMGEKRRLEGEAAPSDSTVLRTYLAEPGENEAEAARAGNLQGDGKAQGDGEFIHPQHRGAVRRFLKQ
ncbi:MAG: hypothetical protein IJJ26_09910 [Victivallales bacterium]|nr:hypothetical protein [Victivallales bacterium]